MAHDIFISYSSHDKPVADGLCAALEAEKIRCWIAPRDILPGMNYAELLVDAINDARIVILVLSSYSNASEQVLREAERAVSCGKIIIPFRIQEVSLSPAMQYYVSTTHWLDAVTPPIEHHFSELAETVRILLKLPQGEKAETAQPVNRRWLPQRPMRRMGIAAAVTVSIAAAILLYILFQPATPFPNFERAYFEHRYSDALELSKSDRRLDNIAAQYYYLRSFSVQHKGDEEALTACKDEYRQLLEKNPQSAEAHFYLGFAFELFPRWRTERDSAYLLINQARQLGLRDLYIEAANDDVLMKLWLPAQTIQCAYQIAQEYSREPMGLLTAANVYYNMASDTPKARQLYVKALELYPKCVEARLGLLRLAIGQNAFPEAKLHLEAAKQVNNTDIDVIDATARLYQSEGRFDLAEKEFEKAIATFGGEKVDWYTSLAYLYLSQDKIDAGMQLIDEALKKFPKESILFREKNDLEQRGRWLKLQKGQTRELVKWYENYDEARQEAKRSKRPLLVDFYTSWCYPCRILEEKTYPDSIVQATLRAFVPLKLNAEVELTTAKRYDVRGYPTLLVLDSDGKSLFEISGALPPRPLVKSLQEGYAAFLRGGDAMSYTPDVFTEVKNLQDACIIARTKHIPIMMVVGSNESKWSEQLFSTTMADPALQSACAGIVYLKADPRSVNEYAREFKLSVFPTILFLDEKGSLLRSYYGYQPPAALARIVLNAKEAYRANRPLTQEINWLYDLEEAKAIATLRRKNIFVEISAEWCEPCKRMKKSTFSEPAVRLALEEGFVCVELDEKRDREMVSSLGGIVYPTHVILNSSGSEQFRAIGYMPPLEIVGWLKLDEKTLILSRLGPEEFKKYQERTELAKSLNIRGEFESAIDVLLPFAVAHPDLPELRAELGNAYLSLNKPGKAIDNLLDALEHGQKVERALVRNLVNAYLQLGDTVNLGKWFESAARQHRSEKDIMTLLYLEQAEQQEILGNLSKALECALNAAHSSPGDYLTHLELGRLLYRKGLFADAKRNLVLANQIDKQDPQAVFYLGLIAAANKDLHGRDRFFQMSLDRTPWASRIVGWRIEYWFRPGFKKYPGYLAMIEEALRFSPLLDPRDPNMTNNLAQFLADQRKDLDEAMSLINLALSDEPEDATVLDTKAWVQYQLGDYRGADSTFQIVERKSPQRDLVDYIELSYHKGKIKLALGDTISARKSFELMLTNPEPGADKIDMQAEARDMLRQVNRVP